MFLQICSAKLFSAVMLRFLLSKIRQCTGACHDFFNPLSLDWGSSREIKKIPVFAFNVQIIIHYVKVVSLGLRHIYISICKQITNIQNLIRKSTSVFFREFRAISASWRKFIIIEIYYQTHKNNSKVSNSPVSF